MKIFKLFAFIVLTTYGSAIMSMDAPNHLGTEKLCTAAYEGNLELVRELLRQGVPVNTKGCYGRTPLTWAAREGHRDTCQLLLEHGASVNAKNDHGCTPLILAAYHGDQELCQLFIKHNALVDAQDNKGRTALMEAASKGHTETCKLLIKHGAKIHTVDNDGHTAATLARINYRTATCAFFRQTAIDSQQLMDAIIDEDLALIQSILKRCCCANTPNIRGMRPIQFAGGSSISNGNFAICHALLQAGAKPILTVKDSLEAKEIRSLICLHLEPSSFKKSTLIALLNQSPEERGALMQKFDSDALEELVRMYPLLLQGIELHITPAQSDVQAITWNEMLGTFEPRAEEPESTINTMKELKITEKENEDK
jgi:hypothetical protein